MKQVGAFDRFAWVLVAAAVFVRLLFASGDGFSYDYANYATYFLAIQDTDWETMAELLPLTFPYVLVPGGGAFELGFVAIAKFLLLELSPTVAYAVIAACSVGLRTYAMRRLGLSWIWIVIIQVYAITLFEANALRAGVALSITLFGILLFVRGRWAWGLLAFGAAASQHLQVALFCIPFVAIQAIRIQWLRKWWVAAAVVPATLVASLVVTTMTSGVDISKLDDYSGQSSGAVGLNLVSVLSLIFVLVALACSTLLKPDRPAIEPELTAHWDRRAAVWLRSLFATAPALGLLLFGTELSAVGDRAWQFSLVILVALSPAMADSQLASRARSLLLVLLLGVALVNTLVRYPLSNFFSPPLPYERIVPLWLVK